MHFIYPQRRVCRLFFSLRMPGGGQGLVCWLLWLQTQSNCNERHACSTLQRPRSLVSRRTLYLVHAPPHASPCHAASSSPFFPFSRSPLSPSPPSLICLEMVSLPSFYFPSLLPSCAVLPTKTRCLCYSNHSTAHATAVSLCSRPKDSPFLILTHCVFSLSLPEYHFSKKCKKWLDPLLPSS